MVNGMPARYLLGPISCSTASQDQVLHVGRSSTPAGSLFAVSISETLVSVGKGSSIEDEKIREKFVLHSS